jgi:diguanylate cyclase (GGDEF)-like protein/PAS domain S-box-containing protein
LKIYFGRYFQERGLRTVFLLPLALALAAFAAVHLFTYIHQEAEYTEEYVDNAFLSAQRVFDSSIRTNTDKLSATISVLSRDDILRRAMRAGDKKALLQRAHPVMEGLRRDYGITHLYFLRPDRSVLLRVHQPERDGDVIDRFTAMQAETTGKQAAGIELGPIGTFTLRTVVPWRDGGRLIGYIELGEEVGYVLSSIREMLGLDLFVAIKKNYLSQKDWAQGMDVLNRQAEWDFLPDSVVVFNTMQSIPPAIQKVLAQSDLSNQTDLAGQTTSDISDRGVKFRAKHLPLIDAGGREVGCMLFARDVTARSMHSLRDTLLATGLIFVMGCVLLWFFYRVIVRVEKRLALSRAEIRENETRFRDLVESSSDWIWEIDASSHYVYVSPKVKDLLGYEPAEVLGKKPFDFMPTKERVRVSNVYARIASERRPFQALENRNLHRDGHIVVLETSGVPILGRDGELLGYRGVDRDISERKQTDERLRAREESLRLIADTVPDILYEADARNNLAITYFSRALSIITGFEPAELIDNPEQWGKQLHELDRERVLAGIQSAFESRSTGYKSEYRLWHKDGKTLLWFEDRANIIYDAQNAPFSIVGAMTDITARKRADEVIQESAQRLSLLFQQTPLAVIEWDIDFRVVDWNPAAEKIFGYSKADAVGRHAAELILPPSARPHVDLIWDGLLTGQGGRRSTNENVTMDGKTIYCEWYNTQQVDVDGQLIGVASLAQDVTEQKFAAERATYLAYYDELTGLPNRIRFKERLFQSFIDASLKSRLVGIIFLDIDHFKVVNDTLGHEAGNELLQAAAKRLQGCFRPGDTVARFGGDEFTIAIADVTHVDDVVHVAQHIVDSFKAPFMIQGNELFVTFSMGISLYPFDDGNVENLLRNADSAMYSAKAEGRNCYRFYAAAMTERATQHLAVQTGLRRALDKGELTLHYQPQLDIGSGRIIGVEALVRWQHPEKGLLSPLNFIPVAEETGLIVPMGEWILREACRQVKAWQRMGHSPVRMAVNLSARQFKDPLFPQRVFEILNETGLDPQYLELEVTESTLVDGMESVSTVLQSFKQAGIMISLDDFGTGYSSLSYLKRFPIDKLKIDQSFVRDILSDASDASLVRAIIAMARALRLRVVAEGVETQGQFDFLRADGCDEIQGYLIGRPMPAAQVAELIMQYNTLSVDD